MSLPVTPEQFLGVFAEYNDALWPAVSGFWLASLGVLVATWRKPTSYSRALTYLLAALWAWNAIAYHVWFFTRINPAAWPFGAAFAFQAALFVWADARRRIEYFSSDGGASSFASSFCGRGHSARIRSNERRIAFCREGSDGPSDLRSAHRHRAHTRTGDGRGQEDFDTSGTPHRIRRCRDATFLTHPHAEIRYGHPQPAH